jgi:hypothetical protein
VASFTKGDNSTSDVKEGNEGNVPPVMSRFASIKLKYFSYDFDWIGAALFTITITICLVLIAEARYNPIWFESYNGLLASRH